MHPAALLLDAVPEPAHLRAVPRAQRPGDVVQPARLGAAEIDAALDPHAGVRRRLVLRRRQVVALGEELLEMAAGHLARRPPERGVLGLAGPVAAEAPRLAAGHQDAAE